MTITGAMTILRPFFRGWEPLRASDNGTLWEHLALEYLTALNPQRTILCWRDTAGGELDFVIPRERDEVDVFECKWRPDEFSPAALKVFRAAYPKGLNWTIALIMGMQKLLERIQPSRNYLKTVLPKLRLGNIHFKMLGSQFFRCHASRVA